MIIKVAIVDKDPRFIDRLTAIFSKNYSDKLEVYPFTDSDVALSTLEFVKPNVLILDESIKVSPTAVPADCTLAYFVTTVGVDELNGARAIYKFQRAELIYKQIAGIFADAIDDRATKLLQNFETKFLVFTSPIGGVGVSTVASACALRIASAGKSVLYLDLDECSNPGMYFRGEGNRSLGDVLHTLVHKDCNLSDLLIRDARKDHRGVSYFQESDPSSVYPELSTEDIARLLRELRVIAAYDYIVIDIPFSIFRKQMDLRERSKGIVLLTDGSEHSQRKLLRGYHAMLHDRERDGESTDSELFLLTNKYSGFPARISALSDLHDLGQIPLMSYSDTSKRLAAIASLELFDHLI